MVVSPAHRQHWQQRRQAEALAIDERRRLGERQAQDAAAALRARWPEIHAVWLFGSLLEPGFGLGSDLDLCVEGLPAEALFAAMELIDSSGPPSRLPVDLVRLESLPLHWQQRLRDQGRALL